MSQFQRIVEKLASLMIWKLLPVLSLHQCQCQHHVAPPKWHASTDIRNGGQSWCSLSTYLTVPRLRPPLRLCKSDVFCSQLFPHHLRLHPWLAPSWVNWRVVLVLLCPPKPRNPENVYQYLFHSLVLLDRYQCIQSGNLHQESQWWNRRVIIHRW